MEKTTLGQKIAELRKAKNMTQLELANQINITDKAVSKWERNLSCPDINTFPKLAEILCVSVDELLSIHSSDTEKETDEEDKFDIALKAIPLALSIAVIVLATMNQLDFKDAATLLGIAVFALSIKAFRKK